MKTHIHTKPCTETFRAALFKIVEKKKQCSVYWMNT